MEVTIGFRIYYVSIYKRVENNGESSGKDSGQMNWKLLLSGY